MTKPPDIWVNLRTKADAVQGGETRLIHAYRDLGEALCAVADQFESERQMLASDRVTGLGLSRSSLKRAISVVHAWTTIEAKVKSGEITSIRQAMAAIAPPKPKPEPVPKPPPTPVPTPTPTYQRPDGFNDCMTTLDIWQEGIDPDDEEIAEEVAGDIARLKQYIADLESIPVAKPEHKASDPLTMDEQFETVVDTICDLENTFDDIDLSAIDDAKPLNDLYWKIQEFYDSLSLVFIDDKLEKIDNRLYELGKSDAA